MLSGSLRMSRRSALRLIGGATVVVAGSTVLAACGSGAKPGAAAGKAATTPMFKVSGGSNPSFVQVAKGGQSVTLTMRGNDIWGTADTFTYFDVKNPKTGAQNWVVKVDSMDPTNAWAKAGIMARQSLDPGSMHVFLCVTIGNGTTLQHRDALGKSEAGNDYLGGSTNTDVAPIWLKLAVDSGFGWVGSTSMDGKTWGETTPASTNPIQLQPGWLIGLATTAHDNTKHGNAVFTNWSGPALGAADAVGTNDNA